MPSRPSIERSSFIHDASSSRRTWQFGQRQRIFSGISSGDVASSEARNFSMRNRQILKQDLTLPIIGLNTENRVGKEQEFLGLSLVQTLRVQPSVYSLNEIVG